MLVYRSVKCLKHKIGHGRVRPGRWSNLFHGESEEKNEKNLLEIATPQKSLKRRPPANYAEGLVKSIIALNVTIS